MQIKINKQIKLTIKDMMQGDIFIHDGSKWLAINTNYPEIGYLKVLCLDSLCTGWFMEPSTTIKYIGKMEIVE